MKIKTKDLAQPSLEGSLTVSFRFKETHSLGKRYSTGMLGPCESGKNGVP